MAIPPSIENNPEMLPLAEADYAALGARWITPADAEAALLRRVHSLYGAEMVGCAGRAGDYSGIAIPYLMPGSNDVVLYRLRREHPEVVETADGGFKPRRKYLSPPGARNRIYFHPQTELPLLSDFRVPVVIVEGEFKTLALWRLAWHGLGDTAETPAFLPIGLQGVWSWFGKVGATNDGDGSRVDVKGPVADLARLSWEDRRVVIVFDSDLEVNQSVADARTQLTRELESRGARVAWFVWPPATPDSQKGIDDYLAANGPERTLRQLAKAKLKTKRRRPMSAAEAARGEVEGDAAWKADLLRGDTLMAMRKFEPLLAVVALYCPLLAGQVPATESGNPAPCIVVRNGVRIPCPENWNIVDEYNDPHQDQIIIGNFPRTPENHNRMSGPGMATIALSNLPKGYEGLDRWIWVGRKNAPDAVERKFDLNNVIAGKISVTCMTSPATSGAVFVSYFFQIGKVPLLFELSYRAQDPKKDEYRAVVERMIERAEPPRR
jgi:hypothetical protein